MNENNVKYWIWLQMTLGAGARFKEVVDNFGSITNLYNSNLLEWKMNESLTPNQIKRLQKYSLDDSQKIIDTCQKNNWQIITYDDERYPNKLKNIINPPAVLYVDGLLPDVDNTASIGVVGTRKASKYAIKVAYIMSKAITYCNALVISGGALGVDTSSHKGALEAGGKTIAVLGCGFGTSYLKENKLLRERIKNNGVLITEYPPFTSASRTTFPLRNRLISGLSDGILVVEAGVKSGSLITSTFAAEQNRDIYTIPASILDTHFAGTNKLIDDGAIVVTQPIRLIEQYQGVYKSLDLTKMKTIDQLINDTKDKGANLPQQTDYDTFDNIKKGRKQRLEKESISFTLSGNEKIVFNGLSEEFEHIDTIAQTCNLSSKDVLTALTMLEIKGVAQSTSGKRYKLS